MVSSRSSRGGWDSLGGAPFWVGKGSMDPDFPATELPKESPLTRIGTDLTFLAARGLLKPVYHRERELEELMKIFARREASNPIILGEPGVGKTVIVHLLAQRIVDGKVPLWLKGYKIIETSFERMYSVLEYYDVNPNAEHMRNLRRVLEECEDSPVILFMDEIHTLFWFPISSKVIMPALSEGTLRVIGATTLKEYRRYIERNEALVRRFTPVYVREPSVELTLRILRKVKPELGNYYGVKIGKKILELTVNLTEKYIHNLYQPGKSIQILEDAAINCAYEGRKVLKREDIMAAVSKRTGVPVEILHSEGNRLLGLEEELNHRVLGQREVIRKVASRIFVARSGITLNPHRPKGVFLFAGPTGVGKTELAKAISSFLTGSVKNMVKLDMSAYRGPYAVVSLLGIPGSGEEDEARVPVLTQAIKDNPYTVLLLDEIEKADPEIWKLFLSVFDEGVLRDLQGTQIQFDYVTVVMTTNVGFSQRKAIINIADGGRVSYEQLKAEVIREIENTFPPEFLARIDEILVFRPLEPDIIKGFINQKIRILEAEVGKNIVLSEKAIDFLMERGFSEKYGARFLERTIEAYVSPLLAKLKLSRNWKDMACIELSTDGDGEGLEVIRLTSSSGSLL